MIKLSEVVELAQLRDALVYSDLNSGAIVGCECGCGGDTMDWEGLQEEYDEDFKKLTELMKKLNVEDDTGDFQ